jgi:hypothetical protein
MRLFVSVAVVAAVGAISGTVRANAPAVPVVIGFDEQTGMPAAAGTPVPEAARLSTNYQSRYGVTFWSTQRYVAVVNLGKSAISRPNGIGGVSSEGKVSYDARNPIFFSFSMPSMSTPAVTDYVAVTCDKDGSGKIVHLIAYDTAGHIIAQDDEKDDEGATLSIHAAGIHTVGFFGRTDADGAALDDVTFDPVTPATDR